MPKPKDINEGPKPYECMACGYEQEIVTNHFGQVYEKCKVCGNCRHAYTGDLPPGAHVPEPWSDEMIVAMQKKYEEIKTIGNSITKEQIKLASVEYYDSNLLDDFIFFIEEQETPDISLEALHKVKELYLKSRKPTNEDV
jgi:hypothetical protein